MVTTPGPDQPTGNAYREPSTGRLWLQRANDGQHGLLPGDSTVADGVGAAGWKANLPQPWR